MEQIAQQPWHSLPADEVIGQLGTDTSRGLAGSEVEQRLQQYGKNVITPKQKQSALVRFLLQFHQPLIYILLVATVVTLLLQEYTDAMVIFGVVFINAIIGYIQETKALQAIDALARSMSARALVVRDGKRQNIDAQELVPGDVVLVQSGDKFPADVRLVHQRDLKVDESALTGESVTVEKNTEPVAADQVLGDRHCMGFATTMVTYGQGRGVVTATGDNSEVGKIQQAISSATTLDTPLTKKIKEFSRLLLWVILGFAILIFAIGMWRGETPVDMFMVAVAMAVGAIPEGLPVAVTIMLALGVSKMAKRRAIIRKLVAVETLGSTTIICSDKTGTLTENQMTVLQLAAGGQYYKFSGIGYRPEGELLQNEQRVDPASNKALELCLLTGLLCNDSALKETEGRWSIEGDPTEGALLVSAQKAGLQPEQEMRMHPRSDTIPFESEYQYMATLHTGERPLMLVKGSVEALLERSTHQLQADGSLAPLDKEEVHRQINTMARNGLRVLAFAMAEAAPGQQKISHADVEHNLTFVGLQGMIDPPRAEAIEAVALCQKAGIDVKMITGDHALTASVIAGQIGLEGKQQDGQLVALTGRELQQMPDTELEHAAREVAVFARVSPDQKLRLVQALQAQQEVVAMTGDGVNDGPALKQADIGIAMGITGTEVAKDASDMVLTDDNFSSIEGAVEEGRGVFDNLTKFIVWTLPTNLGEGLVILVAVLLGTKLPVQPVQILWINMTTAVLLGLMLAFEPKEPGIMDRPPRPANQPILTYDLIMRTLLVGSLIMMAAFGLYYYERQQGASIAEAQTITTTVFVVLEAFYLLNCRSLVRPIGHVGYFSNPWIYFGIGLMMFFQLLLVYTPVMNRLFHTSPISAMAWLRIIAAGAALFLVVMIEKRIRLGMEERKRKVNPRD